jgi:serine/threonine-protein kinase RIO1
MTRRRYPDRAPLASRSYRSHSDVEFSQRRRYPSDEPRVPSELDRDIAAMKRVWQMVRAGAIRMVGEIGRQY